MANFCEQKFGTRDQKKNRSPESATKVKSEKKKTIFGGVNHENKCRESLQGLQGIDN